MSVAEAATLDLARVTPAGEGPFVFAAAAAVASRSLARGIPRRSTREDPWQEDET